MSTQTTKQDVLRWLEAGLSSMEVMDKMQGVARIDLIDWLSEEAGHVTVSHKSDDHVALPQTRSAVSVCRDSVGVTVSVSRLRDPDYHVRLETRQDSDPMVLYKVGDRDPCYWKEAFKFSKIPNINGDDFSNKPMGGSAPSSSAVSQVRDRFVAQGVFTDKEALKRIMAMETTC